MTDRIEERLCARLTACSEVASLQQRCCTASGTGLLFQLEATVGHVLEMYATLEVESAEDWDRTLERLDAFEGRVSAMLEEMRGSMRHKYGMAVSVEIE